MSMDFERNRSNNSVTETENPAFAVTPVWDRRSKKRGAFSRKAAPDATVVAPEPRTFAAERDYDEPMALDTPIDRPTPRPDYVRAERPAMTAAAAETDPALVAPIGRPSTRADRGAKSTGRAPAAIAAGVVALGAVGAVGWMASRGDDGIPKIAPGEPAVVAETTALPPVLPPAPPAADTTVNPLPAEAAPPRSTVRSSQPVRTAQARTRPAAAAAPSAGDTGVNASSTTTLPSGPQPYSTLNPGATPPAPVNPMPTQAAPPPAEAPAAVPQTAPTLPTDPAPETTVTPPTS